MVQLCVCPGGTGRQREGGPAGDGGAFTSGAMVPFVRGRVELRAYSCWGAVKEGRMSSSGPTPAGTSGTASSSWPTPDSRTSSLHRLPYRVHQHFVSLLPARYVLGSPSLVLAARSSFLALPPPPPPAPPLSCSCFLLPVLPPFPTLSHLTPHLPTPFPRPPCPPLSLPPFICLETTPEDPRPARIACNLTKEPDAERARRAQPSKEIWK